MTVVEYFCMHTAKLPSPHSKSKIVSFFCGFRNSTTGRANFEMKSAFLLYIYIPAICFFHTYSPLFGRILYKREVERYKKNDELCKDINYSNKSINILFLFISA
jgi:hypothetical protein